ncbi:MAG: replication protein A [Azospirillum sp.]|nr:replication protein A [Azospirillum sp.]
MTAPAKPADDPSSSPLVVPSDGGCVKFRDLRDLMSLPFFSLSKGRRLVPIRYAADTLELEVCGSPDHGMATIWDADLLIWATSQLIDARRRGLEPSRYLRFRPRQLLTAIGRGTGQSQYLQLRAALQRLQTTLVVTSIRQDGRWRGQPFSWITRWEDMLDGGGRCLGIEVVLAEWLYRAALDRSLVLSLDPGYFGLTGGIERWLYRLARRHAGRQSEGWAFEFRQLYLKSGSLARYADFAVDLRRIAAKGTLLGYHLGLEFTGDGTRLRIAPAAPKGLSPDCVDNPVGNPVDNHVDQLSTFGRSGGDSRQIRRESAAYQAKNSS